MFPAYCEKCLSRKAVHNWVQTFADEEEFETEVRNWLRQYSKHFYGAGFNALVKGWNKCISVDGGYVTKWMFLFPHFRILHVLRFIGICGLFTGSLSRIMLQPDPINLHRDFYNNLYIPLTRHILALHNILPKVPLQQATYRSVRISPGLMTMYI
jgi:hypothetical protein